MPDEMLCENPKCREAIELDEAGWYHIRTKQSACYNEDGALLGMIQPPKETVNASIRRSLGIRTR